MASTHCRSAKEMRVNVNEKHIQNRGTTPRTIRNGSPRRPYALEQVQHSLRPEHATLDQGHQFSFKPVPTEVFAASFPGAAEAAETFKYFGAYTYLGSDSSDRIALANQIAGQQPTRFSAWGRMNFPAAAA